MSGPEQAQDMLIAHVVWHMSMLARLSYYACPKDWSNASSRKAHPEKNTVLRLTDEIIKDGFISA
eukprot:11328037-Alexandrium_andersonii.AAC.1